MMKRRLLLLGHTGKLGTAVRMVFKDGYTVIGKNTADFDASDFSAVEALLAAEQPDIVVNTVGCGGIDYCEKEPEQAFRLNALFPRLLAQRSSQNGFLLVHVSTDSVFNDAKHDCYLESDAARPVNIYGMSKYVGDCCVAAYAREYYICRIGVLFGPCEKQGQFVEKMLQKIRQGAKTLKISEDIISSPTYSCDVAGAMKGLIEKKAAYGLYHTANKGVASLWELMHEITGRLELNVTVDKASHRDFPSVGIKNTYTPLASEKNTQLRPWKEAIKEYCEYLRVTQGVCGPHG